jgi:hypothetical protein
MVAQQTRVMNQRRNIADIYRPAEFYIAAKKSSKKNFADPGAARGVYSSQKIAAQIKAVFGFI